MITGVQPYLIGIDLGGTRIKALALSPDGTELARRVAGSDHPDWAARVKTVVDGLHADLGPSLGIGLAAPGLAAPDGRSIRHLPGRLPGLEGLDWTHHLGATHPVPVLNDAQAALLGEVWRGAARGMSNVLLLTLGTGVGGAILCDGHLLRGHLGRAGHLGHITVDAGGAPDIVNTPGSLEDAIGNHTLGQRSAGLYDDTAHLVADTVRGVPRAIEVWQRSVRDLAAGLASLINVVDPELVLLGGGIALAEDALLRPLHAALDRFEWRPAGHQVRLAATELGDLAGAYGAARQAQLLLSSS